MCRIKYMNSCILILKGRIGIRCVFAEEELNGITSEKDIIQIKFADNRVGVVACSNDINFDIPSTKDEYDEINFTRSGKKKGWKYNTSGILVHADHNSNVDNPAMVNNIIMEFVKSLK